MPKEAKLNNNLHAAKKAKNDEFYTQMADIERELQHYRKQLEGKTIFCNCDDPCSSNFVRYFALNFEFLKLKRVISTHYEIDKPSYRLDITHKVESVEEIEALPQIPLEQNGDFRSPESIDLLKQSDLVSTNPPFSLFREYIAQLMEYKKKFLIIGSMNAITYKEVFPLIRDDKLWLGCNSVKEFITQNGEIQKFGNILWYTNLPHKKRNEELILFRDYYGHEEDYPTYDNYDAIEVSKTVNIPRDYDGTMGVPITFLDKYNPKQFRIIWQAAGNTRASAPKEILNYLNYLQHEEDRGGCGVIDGKRVYARILIRRADV